MIKTIFKRYKQTVVQPHRFVTTCLCVCSLLIAPYLAFADEAAEMQKKLQNPLANIKAIMTDNVIGFDTGSTEDTSFGFQLQPVYAIDMPEKGFTMIPRAVIPIVGLEPGTDVPIVGQPSGTESVWGLSDSVIQLFFAPHTKANWKWGLGPQVSLPTATKEQLEGPQWGAGVAGVLVGNLTEKLAFAGILANQWGENDFNTMILQPMFFYSLPTPGTALAYNAVISADWNASSSNRWTVPLGLSYNKTWDMGDGHGFDFMIGPYYNVARPDGAARWQLRFGLNWLFP
jgi:hypothetical protein